MKRERQRHAETPKHAAMDLEVGDRQRPNSESNEEDADNAGRAARTRATAVSRIRTSCARRTFAVKLLRQVLRSGADRAFRLIRLPFHMNKDNTILRRNNKLRDRAPTLPSADIKPLYGPNKLAQPCQGASVSAFNISA